MDILNYNLWSLDRERVDLKQKIYPVPFSTPFENWDESKYHYREGQNDSQGDPKLDIDEDLLNKKVNDLCDEWTMYSENVELNKSVFKQELKWRKDKSKKDIKLMGK